MSLSKFTKGRWGGPGNVRSRMRETGRNAITSKRFDLFERKRISEMPRICSKNKYPATRMANQSEQRLDVLHLVIFSIHYCDLLQTHPLHNCHWYIMSHMKNVEDNLRLSIIHRMCFRSVAAKIFYCFKYYRHI